MSTQVKNIALVKLATAIVAVAMIAGMLFAYATPRAQAVTLGELVELFIALDIISGDKADEARAVLQNQGGGTTGGSTSGGSGGYVCPVGGFSVSLTPGTSHPEAMAVQKFLNSMADTQIAAVGPGSPGQETDYYGSLTAEGTKKFQQKYAAQILAPIGLTAPTPNWGPATMAQANALCAGGGGTTGGGTTGGGDVPPPPPPAPGGVGDDDDDDDDDDNGGSSSGSNSGQEASLEDFDELGDPSDEELDEGDEDVAIFGFEFDVEDGDASVRRLDVHFMGVSNSNCFPGAGICETDPWKALETVSVWYDGEKIAEEDADNEGDWDEQASDEWRIRFTGLDVDLDEGDSPEFLIGVTTQDNIDDSDLDQTWQVWIPDNGLRALDGAGVDQFTGADADRETFDIKAAGSETELKVREDSSNPDASTIKVDEDNDTDNVTVLVFELEAEDGDVVVNEIPFRVWTGFQGATTFDDVIGDFEVELDGVVYDNMIGTSSNTVADLATTTAVLDLEGDDDEITIDEGDTILGKVLLDLKEQDGSTYPAGTQVQVSLTGALVDTIDAEDESDDSLGASRISGSANGEVHTLIAEGIFAEIVSTDADLVAAQFTGDEEKGDYQIKFDVTAFEEDAYIFRAGFGQTTLNGTSSGVVYAIENNSGNAISTTSTASLTSTADTDNDNTFVVRDGDTETFTLDITLNPDIGGFYRAQLLGVNFASSSAAAENGVGASSHEASPDEDFETDAVDIDA